MIEIGYQLKNNFICLNNDVSLLFRIGFIIIILTYYDNVNVIKYWLMILVNKSGYNYGIKRFGGEDENIH